MSYKQTIIALITSDDSDAYNNWLAQQPIKFQPDIMREFKQVTIELAMENGVELDKDVFDGYDEYVDNYENAVLDEIYAGLQLQLANIELEKSIEKINEARNGIREYVKECVQTNASNAPQMLQLAMQMIALEKKDDMYEAENWNWIEPYL